MSNDKLSAINCKNCDWQTERPTHEQIERTPGPVAEVVAEGAIGVVEVEELEMARVVVILEGLTLPVVDCVDKFVEPEVDAEVVVREDVIEEVVLAGDVVVDANVDIAVEIELLIDVVVPLAIELIVDCTIEAVMVGVDVAVVIVGVLVNAGADVVVDKDITVVPVVGVDDETSVVDVHWVDVGKRVDVATVDREVACNELDSNVVTGSVVDVSVIESKEMTIRSEELPPRVPFGA